MSPRKSTPPRVLDAVIRVSKRNGREGDSFLSPVEQRESIDGWAAANNATIVRYHDETDSVSGKSADRVGLNLAVKRAVDGKTDGIVVAKVDRFARNLLGGLTAVGQLERAGKAFVAVKDGVDGETASTPTGRLLRGVLFLFAEWQLETLTESWLSTREHAIRNGVAISVPYGYRKDATTRRLVPEPAEAKVVRRMFDLRAEGIGWRPIADQLNDEGADTRGGGRWTHGQVAKTITSRTYLGELSSGPDIVNRSAHEAIVPVDVWERANGIRKSSRGRKPGQVGDYALMGIVRCAGCGVRAQGTKTSRTRNGIKRTWRYYKCRRHFTFGECPDPVAVDADELESLIFAAFRNEFSDTHLEGDKATDELDAARVELETAEADLREWITSPATKYLEETAGKAFVEDGTKARADRVAAARERMNDARNNALGVSFPADLHAVFDDLDAEEKRAFLTEAFDTIAVAGRQGSGPVVDRVRYWFRDEEGAPNNLPGRGGVAAITPIDTRTRPSRARETPLEDGR